MALEGDAERRWIGAHDEHLMGGDPICKRVEDRISNLLDLALIAERPHKLYRRIDRADPRWASDQSGLQATERVDTGLSRLLLMEHDLRVQRGPERESLCRVPAPAPDSSALVAIKDRGGERQIREGDEGIDLELCRERAEELEKPRATGHLWQSEDAEPRRQTCDGSLPQGSEDTLTLCVRSMLEQVELRHRLSHADRQVGTVGRLEEVRAPADHLIDRLRKAARLLVVLEVHRPKDSQRHGLCAEVDPLLAQSHPLDLDGEVFRQDASDVGGDTLAISPVGQCVLLVNPRPERDRRHHAPQGVEHIARCVPDAVGQRGQERVERCRKMEPDRPVENPVCTHEQSLACRCDTRHSAPLARGVRRGCRRDTASSPASVNRPS